MQRAPQPTALVTFVTFSQLHVFRTLALASIAAASLGPLFLGCGGSHRKSTVIVNNPPPVIEVIPEKK